MVHVRIPSILRDYADGHASIDVEGSTAREVLAAVERCYPAVGRRVLDEQGGLRRHVHIYIGADRCRSLDDGVPANTEVSILPAVSGGAA